MSIRIFCGMCQHFLYKYQKKGNGGLVKCFVHKILGLACCPLDLHCPVDNTNKDMTCPECGSKFAREAIIKGKLAHKIIGGKVFHRKD
jgi:hypothetical protein